MIHANNNEVHACKERYAISTKRSQVVHNPNIGFSPWVLKTLFIYPGSRPEWGAENKLIDNRKPSSYIRAQQHSWLSVHGMARPVIETIRSRPFRRSWYWNNCYERCQPCVSLSKIVAHKAHPHMLGGQVHSHRLDHVHASGLRSHMGLPRRSNMPHHAGLDCAQCSSSCTRMCWAAGATTARVSPPTSQLHATTRSRKWKSVVDPHPRDLVTTRTKIR
jgi:hypothetical protein